jgi:hypothetical protein
MNVFIHLILYGLACLFWPDSKNEKAVQNSEGEWILVEMNQCSHPTDVSSDTGDSTDPFLNDECDGPDW